MKIDEMTNVDFNENTMKKYVRIATWNSEDIRIFCIRNRYYTRGTCEAYSAMLQAVENLEPTISNLMCVATDIKFHSNTEDTTDDILTLLNREVNYAIITE